jgi:hypothetical protein
MVSLGWMMHSAGGYSVASGEIGLGHGPSFYISHDQWRASTSLAWLVMEMLSSLRSRHFNLIAFGCSVK